MMCHGLPAEVCGEPESELRGADHERYACVERSKTEGAALWHKVKAKVTGSGPMKGMPDTVRPTPGRVLAWWTPQSLLLPPIPFPPPLVSAEAWPGAALCTTAGFRHAHDV
eukprot:176031-Chlamydomonas_euryale.AAC.1